MAEQRFPRQAAKQNAPLAFTAPNQSRPVWVDPQMNCDQCRYNDQDVDTFPCAKCHTRK